MIIKICGLTDISEAELLKKNNVDLAGMVLFFKKSKRNISIEKAKEIIKALHEKNNKCRENNKCCENNIDESGNESIPEADVKLYDKRISAVAVTVSPTEEQVKEIEEAGFDFIQIHGILDEELVRKINIPILKAFNVSDMNKYEYYLSFPNIKGFVFDAGEPGSGKTFDWDTLDSIKRDDDRLYILAGGLNAENVGRAIEKVKPDGVDVSSSVELPDIILEDGRTKTGKDPKLVDEFVGAVRH